MDDRLREITMEDVGSHPTSGQTDFQKTVLSEVESNKDELRAIRSDLSKILETLAGMGQNSKGRKGTGLAASCHSPGGGNAPSSTESAKKHGETAPVGVADQPQADSNTPPGLLPGHSPDNMSYHTMASNYEKEKLALQEQITSQVAEITKLRKYVTRVGRKYDPPIDSEVRQQFLILQSNIHQFVKTHISVRHLYPTEVGLPPDSTHEMKELYVRSRVAEYLYENFFSPNSALFGSDDHMRSKNSFRVFEDQLKQSRYDESQLREWRILTVKASRFLECDNTRHVTDVSREILSDLTPILARSHYEAIDHLDKLCKEAYDLGLLFRSSNIEYQWEQDMAQIDRLDVLDKYEIVGTLGPDPAKRKDVEISFIVFGSVVRGDKGSGLLADGKTRICPAQVVIGNRSHDGRSSEGTAIHAVEEKPGGMQ